MRHLVLALALAFTPSVYAGPVAIIIHGGAGTITPDKLTPELETAYTQALSSAAEFGYQELKQGKASEEVVVAVIKRLEDSPLFNAGHGAVLTHQEKVELDASIMRGSDLNAGAIAAVTNIKNPIELALGVMNASKHVLLTGAGAEQFAREQGFTEVPNDYFITPRRLEQVQKAKARDATAFIPKPEKYGTVGAVALDQSGTISAGTSTGGMTNKRFGRVGDSPIIGAGTYADNQVCGVSATGHGEYFIRAAVAHDICARALYQGISLQDSSDRVIKQKLVDMGGDGGIVGLTPAGDLVFSFNTEGMYRAGINAAGKRMLGIYQNTQYSQ
ncbi:MAG: isoaspartyl peptidase/L-asparaginase [Halieaceae bacterium]|nr:isoaspartyl peptidase/L-asparaginase [Halieaceae bacterium]